MSNYCQRFLSNFNFISHIPSSHSGLESNLVHQTFLLTGMGFRVSNRMGKDLVNVGDGFNDFWRKKAFSNFWTPPVLNSL